MLSPRPSRALLTQRQASIRSSTFAIASKSKQTIKGWNAELFVHESVVDARVLMRDCLLGPSATIYDPQYLVSRIEVLSA